ncbi:MAG: hypothetical protein LBM77_03355 [Spirochaetaceae bacterium]|jgi:hypothetical protein|nr:hypothetical protein [Spirochaetaceae bacterium]
MKKKILFTIVITMCLMTLMTACTGPYTDPSFLSGGGGSSGGGAKGTLTISGCPTLSQSDPSEATVIICDNKTSITTMASLIDAFEYTVAASTDTTSPFSLISFYGSTAGSTFTGNGTYLVMIGISSDVYYKEANFKNGSASFSYSSMEKESDLPSGY